eukprot:Seg389.2 transcript_id=Seg389.2/GoldUCD/mRNA.D3Y31 product="hypothetical protein" protein_id=Seg389.2/GoldUCD/D3Y31
MDFCNERQPKLTTVDVKINYSSGASQYQIKSACTSSIIASLATGDFNCTIRKIAEHDQLKHCLLKWIANTVLDEVSEVVRVKRPSILLMTNCDDLLRLRNEDVVDELQKRAPMLYLVLKNSVISRRRRKKIKDGNVKDQSLCSVAMAFGILMKMRSPTLSALAYRVSLVLHHSGAKKKV